MDKRIEERLIAYLDETFGPLVDRTATVMKRGVGGRPADLARELGNTRDMRES